MANITRTIDKNLLLPGVVGSSLLRVEIVIRDSDPRGLSDGFSITGSVWEARGRQSGAYRMRRGWDIDMGGCLHDMIAAHMPELAPVIAVHLADLDGTPMHAFANGWYQYSGRGYDHDVATYGVDYADRHGTAHQRAARTLHVDPADLPDGLDHDGFADVVDSLRPVWAQQAADARALVMALPEPPTADEIYAARGYDAYGNAVR